MSKKVVTVDASTTAFVAVRKIMNQDIGCVVVMREDQAVGLITKGDILREAVMKKLDPEKVPAEAIMSKPVITASPDTRIEEAAEIMTRNNLSKLPVLSKGNLVGIITSTDILRRGKLKKIGVRDMI